MSGCTQNCDQGRRCTCGSIPPGVGLLIALDIAVFRILTLGRAKPGETISAAAYRAEQQGRLLGRIARPVIDLLLCWVGPQPHCKNAYEWQRHIYD